jgi:hypothetical protein
LKADSLRLVEIREEVKESSTRACNSGQSILQAGRKQGVSAAAFQVAYTLTRAFRYLRRTKMTGKARIPARAIRVRPCSAKNSRIPRIVSGAL